ncbi:MAG: hypothetical protein IPJ94_16345 [Chloroflexi bacterium]|nr:hypothetical protein [Chloroflexota bacterium]
MNIFYPRRERNRNYESFYTNILLLTAGLVGFELLFFAYLLARQSLFHWLSAGFWAWVAFMIYFFVPPVAAVVSGNVYSFQTRLQLGGGVGRGLWVAFVILVGIGVFFLTYLRTRPHRIYLGVHSEIPIVTPFFWVGWHCFLVLAYIPYWLRDLG